MAVDSDLATGLVARGTPARNKAPRLAGAKQASAPGRIAARPAPSSGAACQPASPGVSACRSYTVDEQEFVHFVCWKLEKSFDRDSNQKARGSSTCL